MTEIAKRKYYHISLILLCSLVVLVIMQPWHLYFLNDDFEHIHNLKKLAEKAKSLGLIGIPEKHLDLIQCPAGVRYGDITVSLIDAIQAHHASLHTCWGVTEQISEIKSQRIRSQYLNREEAIRKIVPYKS